MRVFLVACLFGPCVPAALAASAPKAEVPVPFVGCKSDGQVGPLKAPVGKSMVVSISTEAAEKLAYYKAEDGFGVLAPRGWYCFGTYGSNGETLYVSPGPIRGDEVLSAEKWKGFSGPAIEASRQIGDTSGRFEVAKAIARVFPAHDAFVRKVIEERIEPASAFPLGPYPKDKLTYRSKSIVEYETPADTTGLGTQSSLLKNADPIRGVAILVGQVPDLVYLAVRLPPEARDLAPIIVQQVERNAAQ